MIDWLWTQVQPHLEQWVDIAEQMPCLNLPINDVNVVFGLDRQILLDKGVMRIEAPAAWNAPAVAAAN